MVADFNIPFSTLDRSFTQKANKETVDLNNYRLDVRNRH